MKQVIFLAVFSLILTSASFASDPVNSSTEPCCPVVYSSPAVELAYDVKAHSEHFQPAFYNEQTNALHFESIGKINFVQVYNLEGDLKYKLPVMSKKLRLSKNLLEAGDYRLAFEMEGSEDELITFVRVN